MFVSFKKQIYMKHRILNPPYTLKDGVCGVAPSLAYRGVGVRKFQEANVYVTLNFEPP